MIVTRKTLLLAERRDNTRFICTVVPSMSSTQQCSQPLAAVDKCGVKLWGIRRMVGNTVGHKVAHYVHGCSVGEKQIGIVRCYVPPCRITSSAVGRCCESLAMSLSPTACTTGLCEWLSRSFNALLAAPSRHTRSRTAASPHSS
jgi:hypothetical protein